MTENVVEIEGLHKTFRDFWFRPVAEALRGVSFAVPCGSVTGLLGPNGSGKSTTIKILLGLLRAGAGSVRVFGLPPGSRAARARLGYLPELSCLHPFLTARETVRHYAALSGLDGRTAKARTDRLLEEMGLAAAANRAVGGFSKGMARRVALASALVAEPELLVLDEPTSGLDPIGTRETKELIRALAAKGTTILMSSHLLADTEDVATDLVILSGGRVAAAGRTDELLKRRTAARFTVENLDEDAARALASDLENRLGRPVAFDHPSVPLEEFFAETVGAKGA